MILVAGLAVAGLLGIAAAFYFSVRSGKSRSRGGSASSGPARSARTSTGSRAAGSARRAAGRTAPTSGFDAPDTGFDAPTRTSGEPGRLVAGRRARPTPPTGMVAAADEPSEEFEAPAGLASPADLEAEAGTARSRRRGWRKGDDVDRELWPAEAFGGVSD